MAAPDPNRIDISLALLPGESEIVIKDLIEQLTAISGQMAAMMSGDEYAPVQGVMARTGTTASQAKAVDVNIVSVSPHASFAMPTMPNVERAKEKLGAAAAAARTDPSATEAPTEEMDNASQATVTPAGGGGPLPDANVRAAMDEEDSRSRIQKVMDRVIKRREPEEGEDRGKIAKMETVKAAGGVANEVRDYAMTYGVFQHAKGGAEGEAEQLKRSFMPDNLVNVGAELGGEAPTTNYGLGKILGTENVLPGTAYLEAAKGILGLGGGNAASAIGARVEASAVKDAAQMGYLNQEEARTLSHSAIGHGWGEDEADQDRENYGRVRKEAKGGLQGLSAREYGGLTEKVRRDGSSSMKELNEALLAMPKASEAARMGLDEFREASVQYADQLKSQGATFGKAISAGGDFAALTGMAPEVAGQLRQAPIVQGNLAGQGLLPQMQGLASESQVAGIATKQAKTMFDMFRPQMTDTVEKTAAGSAVTASADDKAKAMVASQLGVPVGQVDKLLNLDKGGALDSRAEALTNIVGYGNQAKNLEDNLSGDALSKARDDVRSGGGPSEMITRPEIMESLSKAGVDDEALKKVGKATTATEFQRSARDALASATADDTKEAAKNDETINEKIQVSIDLKMRGAAAKVFENQSIKQDVHRKANKERDRGRGSHNHNNPDGDPPAKGWSLLDALPIG